MPAASALDLPDSFAARLLRWFDRHGRKHLPWQQERSAYRVWISEIMLQQTQVATVIPYYERFMMRFPTVRDLAAAPLDEVLHLWTGLGYYARARNLHRAAQVVTDEYGGEFPVEHEQINALPGIGRSTASAILSISRNERHAILDGNVKRVLARYFGVAGYPGLPAVERELWQHAEALMPNERCADYTQAIMDLGATLCVRSRPKCDACPVAADCVARQTHRQAELPARKPKTIRPQRTAYIAIARDTTGRVLLEQRPPAGLWGGLWTFPQFDSREAAQTWIQSLDAMARVATTLAPYEHSFTHFDLTLHALIAEIAVPPASADTDRYCWYDERAPARIGLAKPAVDLIRLLTAAVQ